MQISYPEEIRELRHQLHRHPELSLCETGTKHRLMQFISSHTALELHDCGAFFYAVYRTSSDFPRPPVAFRAEMDALPMDETISLPYASVTPGIAHKCGHDGHAAALAGFASVLESVRPDRDVYLIFQHAEEIGAGAAPVAEALAHLRLPMIIAAHNWSGYPKDCIIVREGTMHCASLGLTVGFEGVASHASEPEHGKNPAAACSRLALYAEELAGYSMLGHYRRSGRGLVLATVVEIRVGSKDFGMSASRGEVSLTLRAEKEEELEQLKAALVLRARQFSAEYGLSLHREESDVFPVTASSASAVEAVRAAAAVLGLPCIELPEPTRASEDFGHLLRNAEGAIFYIGNGEDYPSIHTPSFDFPDSHLNTLIRMYTELIKIL